ncbi:MAG: hypothetical protein CMM07_17690 [Rhodopirellula sp.]|nr:hypothetical protein [Rhodopirellula sp.]HCA36852.1 hypothetical protein [Gammaproteobacteria bacterium]
MDNQHRKISGYRDLKQEEIDLMNEIKAFGPKLDELVGKVRAYLEEANRYLPDEVRGPFDAAEPLRWVAIGKTDLQTGLMALTRSIAQPTFF